MLSWITVHSHWAYLIVALIAFGESLAIVGLIVPGAFLLFGVGALIGSGELALWPTLFSAAIGAILGDGISFWLGYHYRARLIQLWPFNRYPKLIDRGMVFFKRHGGKSILFGRFVGPVRPIIPSIAGMMRMSVPKYITINLLSALAWAPVYLLPTAFLVGYAKEEVAAVTTSLIIFLALLVAVAWLVFLVFHFCFKRQAVITVIATLALMVFAFLKIPAPQNSDAVIASHWQSDLTINNALQEYGWFQPYRTDIKSILIWLDPQVADAMLPLTRNNCATNSDTKRWSHPGNIDHYFLSWCVNSKTGKGTFTAYRTFNLFSLLRIPIQDNDIEQLEEQLQDLFLATGQSYLWQTGDNGRELIIE